MADKLIVTGGEPLKGSVTVGGRKNSAVAVIPTTLLASGKSTVENLPNISDVQVYAEILQELGARVDFRGQSVSVDTSTLNGNIQAPYDLVKQMRASYYLLGVLLARYGRAEVALPGGCDIGLRPIDQHIKGFRALGAEVEIKHGVVTARAEKLVGTHIYLDVVSVGATINIMLAASLAEGVTVIENAAKESHIVDVASYINAAGGRVQGAGTDVIKVYGVEELTGTTHAIIPDEIEAATFLIAAAATNGDIKVENVIPSHLQSVGSKLQEAGVTVIEEDEAVRAISNGRPQALTIKTLPYPGFPTDAQQPMTTMLTVAQGTSLVTESIWESRFKYTDELKRMGAEIRVEGRTAIIDGIDGLSAAPVKAGNLRAAAALVIAGCMADGMTEVFGVEHLDRGYEDAVGKFRNLGAQIERVPTSD